MRGQCPRAPGTDVPDAGLPSLTGAAPLVRVLKDALGSQLTVRVSVPRALSNVPRVRVVIERLEAFVTAG